MDSPVISTAENPAALLEILRDVTPDALLLDRLDRAIAGASGGSSPAVRIGASGRLRARLLAHRETATFDWEGSAGGLASNVAEAVIELNELYTYSVRFDVGRRLLQTYTARWPNARPLAILPPIVGCLDRPLDSFRDKVDRDVQVAQAANSNVTFVVFCGLRHAFGVQLNVFHHCCLAKHGVNVVYLRDFAQNLYLTGVQSIGSIQATCSALRDIFARLNTRKLIFIGNSSGVFGALHYGAIFDANAVLLFSGPSSLDIGLEETERQAYPRLMELRRAGKIEWPDLRKIYAAKARPVSFYYGARNRVDVAQAENLAGLPDMGLHPIDTASHFVLDRLALSGDMDRIFAAAAC